jgi:hypothetical protein
MGVGHMLPLSLNPPIAAGRFNMPDLHRLTKAVKATIRHSYNRDLPPRACGAEATGPPASGAANNV